MGNGAVHRYVGSPGWAVQVVEVAKWWRTARGRTLDEHRVVWVRGRTLVTQHWI